MENRRSKKRSYKKSSINKTVILRIGAWALIILVVFLSIFGLVKLFDKKEPDDGLTYNKNRSFIKEQKVEGILFKNIKCSFDGKDSLITYDMINTTNKKIYLNNYDVIVKDKDKNMITKIVASYSHDINPKKAEHMANSVVGTDLSNAYYMELKVKTGKK